MTVDLYAEVTALEERLLGTWTRRPGLRGAWTPDAREFFAARTQAVAAACAAVADLTGNDLGTAVMVALASAGKLKLWPPGAPVMSHEDLPDPIAALERWRDLRSLIALRKGLQDALAGIDGGKRLSDVRSSVLDALRASESQSATPAYSDAELMGLALTEVSSRDTSGHTTGFDGIDRITGGLRPGHVWVVGAPTNWGKSSLALAVLDHHQLNGRRALMVSCEDAPELLATRLLCRRARLPGGAARDGRLTETQLAMAESEVVRAAERGPAPVLIDGRGRDCEHLAGDIRAAARAHGVGLVLVDYLQCITTGRETQDRRAEINHIARTLTDAIKTSDCSGILLSQLTGEDIRESRDVEHAAEVVLIGRKGEANGELSLFVKKNKCGPKDQVIELQWEPLNGSFKTDCFDYDGFDNEWQGDHA